ncbi:MAG TPA: hypothetical protein VGA89_03140 [Patescibacteria group bacterium]|jgi:hypothetical protein
MTEKNDFTITKAEFLHLPIFLNGKIFLSEKEKKLSTPEKAWASKDYCIPLDSQLPDPLTCQVIEKNGQLFAIGDVKEGMGGIDALKMGWRIVSHLYSDNPDNPPFKTAGQILANFTDRIGSAIEELKKVPVIEKNDNYFVLLTNKESGQTSELEVSTYFKFAAESYDGHLYGIKNPYI